MDREDKRYQRLLAKVRTDKRKKAESKGGVSDAEALLRSATAALIQLLDLREIPVGDRVALEFLADGLKEWRNGGDISTALCIRKECGAPKKSKLMPLIELLPKIDAEISKGLNVTNALKAVSRLEGVSVSKVKRPWLAAGGLNGYERRRVK